MEGSEDDAGAATNASRRASAREKDVQQSEDGGANDGMPPKAAEATAAGDTASMSEEVFDGDSVPSPSTHDVNTSTEAILDMIDEIVDGPDAPKRRPRSSGDASNDEICASTSDSTDCPQNLPTGSNVDPPQPPLQTNSIVISSETVSQETVPENLSENVQSDIQVGCSSNSIVESVATVAEATVESRCNTETEYTTHSEASTSDVNTPNVSSRSPSDIQVDCESHKPESAGSQQASSSMNLRADSAAESTLPDENAAVCLDPEVPTECPPLNFPSSSVVEMVQSVSDTSDMQNCERTLKCVTSSDNRENVTVESAESTSNDSSVSEYRAAAVETVSRSPLRRRLVRPAPIDRRPDSTVSSTVDSQSVNVHTTKQTSSESVAKDVSSSSDAVPHAYGNFKPEEIRNVSEISVCKAETSGSSPKKIRLVRQKITPPVMLKDNIPEKPILIPETVQCQSISSESIPSALAEPVSSDITRALVVENEKTNLIDESVSNKSNANIPEPIESPAQTSSFKESANVESLPGSSVPPEKEKTSKNEDQQKVPPIKLNLNTSNSTDTVANAENTDQQLDGGCSSKLRQETPELTKAVPKLTIKLGNKPLEEAKSPVPKLTIKPIKPPAPLEVTKLDSHEQIPSVTKINIKPIPRPPEKVNDIHRKSSSSEISESESSENDESNSTSDQTSTSDQGSSNVVPKVTIKLGKPGTESEGKFYTQQNIPKLTIKGIQHSENEDQESTLKLVISQSEDKQMEKIPKLTIKTVTKSESQPLSPKLTIKPLKPPENIISESSSDQVTVQSIPKLKISTDPSSTNPDLKENTHVPKITIKPVIRTDNESISKTSKKSTVVCDSPDHIPVVTKLNIKPVLKPSESVVNSESLDEKLPIISKLNIKPILKPTECNELSEEPNEKVPVVSKLNIKPILKPADMTEVSGNMEDNIPVVSKLNIKPILKPTETGETSDSIEDKVPVVSKLNIKPIIKPKDDHLEDSTDNLPKITKLNIKPLKAPEEGRDCDELKAETLEHSIPIITKLNIKPIIKPVEEEDTLKDSENQSSETGNSSDDNTDHIPVVTKLNIKPILRPNDSEESAKTNASEDNIPVVTKLNIKPLIKPEENKSPSSPKKDILKLTKLTIKPIVKPEENEQQKYKNDNDDVPGKNPPLVMKINMKAMVDMSGNENLSCIDKNVNNMDDNRQHIYNNVSENIPVVSKLNIKPITKPPDIDIPQLIPSNTEHVVMNCKPSSSCTLKPNCVPNIKEDAKFRVIEEISEHLPKNIEENLTTDSESSKQNVSDNIKSPSRTTTTISLKSDNLEVLHSSQENEISESKKPIKTNIKTSGEPALSHSAIKLQSSLQNCTLLKKLLETKKDGLDKRLETKIHANHSPSLPKTELTIHKEVENCDQNFPEKEYSEISHKNEKGPSKSPCQENVNSQGTNTLIPLNLSKEPTESLTKPLEINVPEKVSIQSSGQDSPRIILKINKTDHGASAKIITEETRRGDTPPRKEISDNTQEIINDKQNLKKIVNSRKKQVPDMTPNMPMGKRLRSSRIVDSAEKTPLIKRNIAKRASSTETSPQQVKEPELSVLETKRLKLGQLLSNKSLTITPVPSKVAQVSPPKSNLEIKQGSKTVNHSLLNNENCAKNGNSKLHNILSNLQAKQAQALAFSESNQPEKKSIIPELDCSASTGSSDVVEIVPVENSHPAVQEMIITENSASHDFAIITDDVSQDPLEVETSKIIIDTAISPIIPKPVEMTPQPKKRGRPRKVPMSEGAKPLQPTLPIPALEERPQRSLRLSRDRPAILVKPRGRGRGRGKRQAAPSPPQQSDPLVETASKFFVEELKTPEEIDPTSSRIKLPRMTEALDKMPASVTTPLTSRRRNSSATDLKLFADAPELKVVLSTLPKMDELSVKSPETPTGRGGRGSRGGRGRGRGPGRSPRGRGRGRGGGRGAMYMKETMGIYGRVCGPATTTVQLFEEETCMMDDNATPAKPSHLLDEDSQSSVKSSTNESSKMKKSKFEDLFDSNKVWTAADVKEYVWPPPGTPDVEHQVMMIQEQVAMFLGVKSFKRRYPELKRRTVGGEEKDFVLSQGLVTEALCDLGITAVDASEVLDIMLSDYPHKYEEYRSHQRERQRAEASSAETTQETKPEAKVDRVEMKAEMKPVDTKPEPSKIDLEKSRLDMAVAAIASASEWNTRMNALRRVACVDLQSMSVHRRRAPPRGTPPSHVRPPAGFYPHALLPGQYQHTYRHYTPEQLRYFPLNTTVAAPPAPPSPLPSSSDSEPEWGSSSSSEDSATDRLPAKRKKLTKMKRSSQAEVSVKEEPREEVETCRACKLRLEANRKYTHERFLVCANCNAKLHPSCVELGADTIRKCREYAWQCAECKTCCSCQLPADDDKMLFCDLCDRGFHIYCVGLEKVPSGRWHCVECAKCKSCGSRDPSGPSASGSSAGPVTPGTPVGSITPAGGNEWHHQTRRGPGGHKVYSHSLCTPCARAYRIGRYCPLCERSFIGPKGTMQLVICKLCDRQHHQDCVRQTVSHLKVLDYTCGECRRGGITSRAAAVRLAPRTIATLFMAKRRFNKYAHRQYMQSRMQGQPKGVPASDHSNDLVDDPAETSLSCEPEPVLHDDAADVSDASDTPEVSDPLEGAGEGPKDETASAVASIRMDFGD